MNIEETMTIYDQLNSQLQDLKSQGLYKEERLIDSPQQPHITLSSCQKVLNFCANNYLGLANDPRVIAAAKASYDHFGFGMASVRFICGTQTIHRELEQKLSKFLGTEDTIIYSSCFDANGGLFETILGTEDAIISDSLNHASIIDGIRLCKAKRLRFRNNDMADLEKQLQDSKEAKYRLIATDGVFSMDGTIANLQEICSLAKKYDALVMIDDCHSTGFMGDRGRGTPEYCDVMGKVDIITGTFGKALGGASGGYISGKKELIEWLRQRSRPYLFSNALAPNIVAATLAVLDIVDSEEGKQLRKKLHANSALFRKEMSAAGFKLVPGHHPIIPVMLGDAKLAKTFASKLLEQGIYVIGFSYPVVPEGQARIRTQLSAAHTTEDVLAAVKAFIHVGKELGVVK
jgi:glycine C-acetyltransferase